MTTIPVSMNDDFAALLRTEADYRIDGISSAERIELDRRFDAIVLAGNVMIFLTPGTEGAVLHNMARHLAPGGVLIAGFQLHQDALTLDAYDHSAASAGLDLFARYATWDGVPWTIAADYAVSIHRRPAG